MKKRAEWNPWNFPVARSGVLSGAWSAKIWGKLIPLHFPARAGEKEALEDGLWMFGKDLVVMAEFDGAKTIDEIEFNSVLIWVRVLKMPLGLMNKTDGELIGEMIGEVMEVDADDTDMAIGLMRRVTLDQGEGQENTKWLPWTSNSG